ncbi:MAG TPA: hypothetical protein VGS21_09665, partial [Acidimicrobiales bacterium]|nr:hypothetical protein [Acidimicrobiales bacterium]
VVPCVVPKVSYVPGIVMIAVGFVMPIALAAASFRYAVSRWGVEAAAQLRMATMTRRRMRSSSIPGTGGLPAAGLPGGGFPDPGIPGTGFPDPGIPGAPGGPPPTP